MTQPDDWVVLRCAGGKTMPLMRRLNGDLPYGPIGAWTPVWKRKRRLPRSNITRLLNLPAMPTFVFAPANLMLALPTLPAIPYSIMRIDGKVVTVSDASLEPMRKIDTLPKDPIKVLPKIGARMRFGSGPFEGLNATVVYCTNRYAKVMVDGFALPLQVPPSILQETVA